MLWYLRNLLVFASVAALIWYLWRRVKQRREQNLRCEEALEILEPVKKLYAELTDFQERNDLLEQIETCDEELLPELLRVSWTALSGEERPLYLNDGIHDREDWIAFLTVKQNRALTSSLPCLLTEIYEKTWCLREQSKSKTSKAEQNGPVTGKGSKCCICGKPVKYHVYRYDADDAPEELSGLPVWFSVCSAHCREVRLELAENYGEYDSGAERWEMLKTGDDES